MKKMILCGMFLGLLTGMCLAQRGGARPMGPVGANAGPSPNVGMPSHAVTLPDARAGAPAAARYEVSTHARTVGPNAGMTNAKTVGPNAAAGSNAKTAGPNAAAGANTITVGPTAAAGTTAKTVGPTAEVGTNVNSVGPDAEPDSRAPTANPNATTVPVGPKPR